ncbi:piggyBac transposable element-derived protein 4-like [Cydia splendana]|uniref:piggyBac transposable element-derived protein 4-like n=1 Tax=Cydia splendana TaxID=1100963 RepID=UPI00300D856C
MQIVSKSGLSQISKSVTATPVCKKVITKAPPASKKVITGLDYGTKKAEEIFDNWCKELEDESDLDENDEESDQQTAARIDINLEAAVLPQNISQEAQQWLNNEDAEADRTIQQMLPIDHFTFEWECDPKIFSGQREAFTATPGPTFDMDQDTTPLTVFKNFFDNDLLDLIVTQTNKHSNILVDKVTKENSRLLKWKNTDRAEVVVFLAMLILQGLAPLNVEYDYWRENGYLTLKYFKLLMTFGRFVLIKRLLHFTDNETDLTGLTDSQRKLFKIWPVSDVLNKRFSSLYIPRQSIAIDESLLKWHGRLSFAQKIATKAAKTGIKSYELCESDTGYLWSFFIYAGKEVKAGPDMTDNEQTDITDDIIDLTDIENTTNNDRRTTDTQQMTASASSLPPPPQNATAQIVQNLAKPLLGKGYTLIMDNFYNSPLLARYLKSQKTDCFGTLRVNREFVPEAIKGMAKTEMRVGEVVQTFSRDLSIMLWRDTNIVSMISTFHGGNVSGKEKYGKYKYKPEVVCDYNLAMGGVDKKDQLLSAHPIERARNQAWYKKVFRRLLNVTIHNSYVIFKTQHPTITSRAFRQRLAEEMIKAYRTPQIHNTLLVKPKVIIQYPGEQSRPILQGNHFIGQGVSKYKICAWCHQSRTKYICKQCDVSLCLENCFEEYHTKH